MEEEKIKDIISSLLKNFKKELDDSILKSTLERNESLIKAIRNDYRDVNIESLITDYLNIGDLIDVSINYSFVNNKRLKKQLTIDNIQMEKARLGLINGTPDFLEYNKYAHFQIEGLISYYTYKKSDGDFDKFKNIFNSTDTKESKSFSDLSFYQKMYATNQALKINPTKDYGSIRQNISNVRNSYLHRSFQSIKDDFFESFPDGQYPKDLNGSEDENKKIIKNYYVMKFIIDEKYTEVRLSVRNLSNLIKNDLKI